MPSGIQQETISEIGECDALLGRGTGPNENPGNKMFRAVLRKHLDDYRLSSTREEKRQIVLQAVKDFQRQRGRFLQRVVLSGKKEEGSGNQYKVLNGAAVFLKTRQAFRYMLRGNEYKNVAQERASFDHSAVDSRKLVATNPQKTNLELLQPRHKEPVLTQPGISPLFGKDTSAQLMLMTLAPKQNPLSLLSHCSLMELYGSADKKLLRSPETMPCGNEFNLVGDALSRPFVSSILPHLQLGQNTTTAQFAASKSSPWMNENPIGRAAMLLRARVQLAEQISLEQLVESCLKETQLAEFLAPNLNSDSRGRRTAFSKF